jgi:hypothetical protein
MTQAPDEHLLELLRVFKNTPSDLDANRLGQLGSGQLRRLRRSAASSVLIMVAVVAALIVIILLVGTRPIAPWRWALIAVVALGGLAVGVQRSRELRRALREHTVEALAGSVKVRMQGRSGWWLTVADQSFHLPVRFWHVGPDLPYRVYVARAAKLIVAMEPAGAIEPAVSAGSQPERQLSLTALIARPLVFAHTGDGERPFTASADGVILLVQVNDFPAEPLYSVLADGTCLGDLDDWPAAWTRPDLPPALRDLAAQTPGGPELLAQIEPLDPAALHAWARTLCLAPAPDARGALLALHFSAAIVPDDFGRAQLQPPPAQSEWARLDERDGKLHGLQFKPGPVPVTRAALDAEFGIGREYPRVHWDSPFTLTYFVTVENAPFACDVVASFRDQPGPATAAYEISLRRHTPWTAGPPRTTP